MGDYPEHEKLEAVKDQSQAIGEFLDTSGYTLCVVRNHQWVSVGRPINQILAGYFGIDLGKIEEEKRTMLAKLGQGD